jgi:hypothetical protein
MYADKTSFMINTNASLADLNKRLEDDNLKVYKLDLNLTHFLAC